jgi:tetratricopeptide (TPR) repeat protein
MTVALQALFLAAALQGKDNTDARRELDKHLNSGHAKLDRSETQGALADYARAITLDPRHARGYSGRGMAYYRLGRPTEALKDFNRALELDARHTYAWVGLGDLKIDAGDFDGAIAEYTKAVDVNPTSAQAFAGRALGWSGKGEYDRAMPDFRRAADLLRNAADAWSYYYRGLARHGLYEFDKAAADLAEATKLDPKNSRFFLMRGRIALSLGKGADAGADFRKASSSEPKIAIPASLPGDALYVQGEHAQAADAWKKVLPKDPKLQDGLRIKIWLAQSRAGQDKEAKEELEAWLKDRKPAPDEVTLLAVVAFFQGQILEGLFLKDIDNAPDRRSREKASDFHFYAGAKRLLAGDKPAALAQFKHSVALNALDRFSGFVSVQETAALEGKK